LGCLSPPLLQVLHDTQQHVGVAVLNRPKALNALNCRMVEALYDLYTRWDADPRVACIVLKARGCLLRDCLRASLCLHTMFRLVPESPAWQKTDARSDQCRHMRMWHLEQQQEFCCSFCFFPLARVLERRRFVQAAT
jgi:hypothetical protein